MNFKKVTAVVLSAAIAAATLCACAKDTDSSPDFQQKTVVITGDFASVEYINALANNTYFLDVSLFYEGMLIYNTVARNGNATEARAEINGVVSHSLALDGITYVIDDEHKVYFAADPAYGGLQSSIDYSNAQYIGSGKEVLMTGYEHNYDEFTCKTADGLDCGVKLFTNEEGSLVAIVDYYDGMSIERAVSYFSSDIPEGWLALPEGYTLIDEETYFNDYIDM